ncbi:MAG: c-type cytochrome [Flavobacteriales bacterium]
MSGIHRNFFKGLFILSALLFISNQTFAQIDAAKIFRGNCASCHRITDQKLVGPGLYKIRDRWPDEQKLIAWIRNSQEFLKTGDAYANALFKEYGGSIMPSFSLSDEEIIALIDYSHAGPADAVPTGGGDGVVAQAVNVPVSSVNYTYILIGIGILLLILISVLSSVKSSLEILVNERKGIEPTVPEPAVPLGQRISNWASNNKKIVAVLGLFIFVWILKQGWDGLMGIGVYEGYAPEQPIKFSHKLHAGENQISCVYCHSGVEKSKHANIPSANVCMNCHMYIQEGPQYGKEEISKIYAALDYNPETREYGPNQKPIKWIRIHSLPDHAYFNHAQHVAVGKVECTTCHGPVQEMEVLYQHSPLTMGWCINCHRETEVDFNGNGYYEELHKQFVEENKKNKVKNAKFTVEKIGGLECSKCHY